MVLQRFCQKTGRCFAKSSFKKQQAGFKKALVVGGSRNTFSGYLAHCSIVFIALPREQMRLRKSTARKQGDTSPHFWFSRAPNAF